MNEFLAYYRKFGSLALPGGRWLDFLTAVQSAVKDAGEKNLLDLLVSEMGEKGKFMLAKWISNLYDEYLSRALENDLNAFHTANI